MSNPYKHIQERYEANMQLPKLGLILLWQCESADRILACLLSKPSGVPYEELSPGKM